MFNLTFTPEQMKVLSDALSEMPFKIAAPLINDINAQITNAQQNKVVGEVTPGS